MKWCLAIDRCSSLGGCVCVSICANMLAAHPPVLGVRCSLVGQLQVRQHQQAQTQQTTCFSNCRAELVALLLLVGA